MRLWRPEPGVGSELRRRGRDRKSIISWEFGDQPDRDPLSANLHRGNKPDRLRQFIQRFDHQQQDNPVVCLHASASFPVLPPEKS